LTHAGRAALGEQLAGLKALVGAGLARIAIA
jgi:hypothetical protein